MPTTSNVDIVSSSIFKQTDLFRMNYCGGCEPTTGRKRLLSNFEFDDDYDCEELRNFSKNGSNSSCDDDQNVSIYSCNDDQFSVC